MNVLLIVFVSVFVLVAGSGHYPQPGEHLYCQKQLRQQLEEARKYYPPSQARAVNCGPDGELCQTCCEMLTYNGWRAMPENDNAFPSPNWTPCGGPSRVCYTNDDPAKSPPRCKDIADVQNLAMTDEEMEYATAEKTPE